MIRIGKLDLSPGNRIPIVSDGDQLVYKTMVLRPDPAQELTPNAFLVDQGPGQQIRSHYHVNSQFQVFVGGSGTLGRREAKPFIVQYVAPHTGYGPIVAGERGLWYFTLRPSAPTGARYLPEARPGMDMKAPKRQVTSEPLLPDSTSPAERLSITEMIAPQSDGLAAWMIQLPPGQVAAAPRHEGGLARYYLVAGGEMRVGEDQLGPLSLAWVTEGDIGMDLKAGKAGLRVIGMQFPQGPY